MGKHCTNWAVFPTHKYFLHQLIDLHLLVPTFSCFPFVHCTFKDISSRLHGIHWIYPGQAISDFDFASALFSSDILPPHIIIYRRERLPYWNLSALSGSWQQSTLTDLGQGIPQKSHHTTDFMQYICGRWD